MEPAAGDDAGPFPVALAAFAAVAPSFRGPKPNAFVILRFTVNNAGPRPSLRGTRRSSGVGLGSSRPYDVSMRPGLFGLDAKPGRPLKRVVPYRSLPAVMSKGAPDWTITNGLKRTFQRVLMDPPRV